MYNLWHYHLSLKKEESWYGLIHYKAGGGIVDCSYSNKLFGFFLWQSSDHGTIKIVGTIFTFSFFLKTETS